MSVLDLTLVKGPYGKGPRGPATIDGWPFNIDPTSVSLPVRAKVQKFRTVGGFVVQVYGTTWGDLTVSGQFGTGGWVAQWQFLERMISIAQKQTIQRQAKLPGQNFSPSQPFRFTYPLLNWDFLCYLKAYTSPDGPQAVHMENTNINPKWTLTLFVVTDNGSLVTVSKNAYLQRLAPGLGVMWDSGKNEEQYVGYSDDEFNAPLNAYDVQAYVNSPTGLGSSADVVPSAPSNIAGPTTTPDPNGSASAVGTTGKSVMPGNVENIKSQNDFSVALLSYLGVVPGTWAVGSPQATNDVLMLNAQQAQEGMWSNSPSSQRYAGNMHNPLNINGTGPGFVNIGGTDTFTNWSYGVAATGDTYKSHYANAVKGLIASNFHQWMQGLQVDFTGPGAWAGDPNYPSEIHGIYTGYGGSDPQ
jgi:hypothetical protein